MWASLTVALKRQLIVLLIVDAIWKYLKPLSSRLFYVVSDNEQSIDASLYYWMFGPTRR